jgi:hypothetical protein
MTAVFVAATTHTSLDVIERWPPNKLLAYFEKAVELRKIMKE